MAQQKAFQKTILLPAGLGDWTQLKPKRRDEQSIQIGPIKGVYFDRLPELTVNQALDIHYKFSQDLVAAFSQKLKIKIELHAVRCLQASYSDFLREISHRVYQANFAVLGATMHLYVDDVLASALVNRALGGKGEASPDTNLSTAERAVMLQLVNAMADGLKGTWQGALPSVSTMLADTHAALQVDSTLSKEDTYVVFTQDLVLGDEPVRSIRWGYSRSLLRKLLSDFDRKKAPKVHSVRLSERVQHHLKVPVRLVLGATRLTATELKKLQVGDVVALDTSLTNPVQVKISDQVTLYGQPGLSEGHMGVQLLSANALAMVQREQMAGGSPLQQLVVDDESLIDQARASQRDALSIDLVDEEDEQEELENAAPISQAAHASQTDDFDEGAERVEAADTMVQTEPVAAQAAAETALDNVDDATLDEDELDDLFADEDFNWDEDVDADKEN